jgi:kynurenine 3-monooxygenase
MVGPVVAMYMARRFGRVEVIERHPAPTMAAGRGRRSLTVILSARGWRVLRDVRVADTVREICLPLRGRLAHLPKDRSHFTPYSHRNERIWCVERDRLHRLLLDAAQATHGIRIHFGLRVREVDLEAPALMLDRPSGPHALPCRHVLGCDGVQSPLRAALVARGASKQVHRLDLGYKEIDVVATPDGAPLARDAFHYWPRGKMLFGAFPNLSGGFNGSLFMPLDGPGPTFASVVTGDEAGALFEREFPDAMAIVPDLGRQFYDKPVSVITTVRCDRWVWDGTAALVGDSCHAMAPFMGQGMNCGFEDARILDECLDVEGDWAAGLAAYERRRMDDANAIADISQEHYHRLTAPLSGQGAPSAEQALADRLCDVFPERFTSLYERCAFSEERYTDALRQDHAMRDLVAALLMAHGEALSAEPEDRFRQTVTSALRDRHFLGRARTLPRE